MAREVAFLDADISAIEQLRVHLKDGVYAIVLSRDASALAQIADGIKSHRDIEAIHIIAHGRPGSIEFAAGPVGADALDLHADDLAAIGRSLDGGEIRLWTCETASGAEGVAFLAALAGATGASVAASTGLVGAADKGGTWELDVQTRPSHALPPLTAQGMEVYSGVMSIDDGTVTAGADGFLNASELASGLTIDNISRSASSPGNGFLVAVFTSSSATSPIYWITSNGDQLTQSSTDIDLTIPTAALGGYQGQIYIRIYQGDVIAATSSNSGNVVVTGGVPATVNWPAGTVFELNDTASTGVTTSTAISATGQRTQGPFTIDTSVPNAPSITSITDNVSPVTGTLVDGGSTNDTTPTIRISLTGTNAVSGDRVQLYNNTTTLGTAVTLTATDISNGFLDITTSALTNGTAYNFRAAVIDAAGNTSASSASGAWDITIDTTVPSGTPTISAVTDNVAPTTGNVANGGTTNDNTLAISGTGTTGNTVSIYDGATLLGSVVVSGGNWSFTTAALTDGGHSFTARYTDAAGNEGTATAARTVTVDATAPNAPTIATVSDDVAPVTGTVSDNGSSNDTTLTITGAAEAGSTVTIYDTNGTTVLGTGVATGGTYTITTSALGQGAHTLTARATDAAGNQGAASTAFNVTIDTTAPTAPTIATVSDDVAPVTGTVSNNGSSNDTTLTITGSAEAGSTVTIYDTNGTTVLGTAVATGGTYTITTSALGQGAHTLTARATDAAGNQGTASTAFNVTIDTAAPNAPTITTVSDDVATVTGPVNDNGTSNDATLTISGSAEAGSTVTIYDTDGTTVLGTAVATGGTYTITTSTLSEGAHTLTAKATDAAGNQGAASAAFHVTTDTTAPTVSVSVDNTTLITGGTATVTFTFSEVPSNFTDADVTVENGTISSLSPTGNPLVFTAILTPNAGVEDSSNVITVGTAWTDAAGNSPATPANSNPYAIDTAASAPISIDPVTADNIINHTESGLATVTITGTVGGDVQDGDIITLTVNGHDYAGSVNGGIFSIDVSGGDLTADTNIHASITVSDTAGNVTTVTADHAYQVDLAASAIIAVNNITADNIINAAESGGQVAVTGTVGGDVQDGATVTLTVNGHNYNGTVSGTSFSINVDGADLVLDTNVHASVSATDAAGNAATGTADHAYQVDLAATATIAVNDITADNVINAAEAGGTVMVTGTVGGDAKSGDAVTLTVNGHAYNGTVSGSTFSIAVGGADLAADTNIHASVTATDAAGNPATAEDTKTYSVDTTADAGGDLAVSVGDNLVNNAEKANVAYTVNGLDAGATATVTFSDGKNSVVGANGVVDLTGLTDGPITATVSVTDAAGNTATGVSGATVLDTTADQGSDLAVSVADDLVNNAEKGNVAYTVTGLDAGATATVTFTSSNGGSPIVLNGVTGSGIANLTGLADGDITVTITATDTAGNHADGAPGATLLDTQADGFVILDRITDDNVINATEAVTANIAITGFVGGDAKDGDSVTLTVNGETYTGTVSDSAFSINVKGSDLANDPDSTVDVSVTATDELGNTTALTSSQAYTVDTGVEAWIVINPITDDNIINAEEAGQTISVTGQLGPDVADGTTVTLTIGLVNYTGQASGSTFSIDVPGSALALGSAVHASVTATDAFGNEATETADLAYTVDLSGAASITLDVIAGDDIINAAEESGLVTLTGTVGGDVQDGDLVTLTVHGSEYVGFVSDGTFSIDVLGTDLALDTNVHASVSTIDSSGNPATATADRPYTVDTTADQGGDLAVSVTDNLVGNAEMTSVAYTVAGLDGDATATVTFTDGTNSVQGVNGVADLSGLADGPITATVSATDAAGNTATGASGATVLDTIADEGGDLAVSVTDNLVNNAEKATVAYTLTGLDGDATATVTFSDGKNSVVGVNGVADLSGLTDGPITASVSATDTAGNTAAGTSGATVLDTTADKGGDLAVSVTDNLVGNAEKTNVAYTVAGLDGDATATVTFSDGKNSVVGVNGVADLSGLSDGPITATVSATDTAGNSAAGTSGATVLDTTADKGGDLAVSVTDNLIGAAEKANVAYTVAGLDLDATATVTFSDGKNSVVGVNGVADLSGLSDGPITATVSATDTAGNSAAGASGGTVLDTVADEGGDLAVSVGDNLVNNAEKANVAYTVAGLDGDATATVTFTDGKNSAVGVNGVADLSGLTDGPITASVSATDTAGNSAAGASGATVLDTTADQGGDLAVSVTDNLIGAAEKANVAYTVTGLDLDATATVTFSDGKNSVVGVNGVADLSGLADGPITATVSATDTAGNTAAGAPGSTVLDTTADGDLAVSIADNLIGNAEKANVAYTVTGLDVGSTAIVTFTSSNGGAPIVLTGITSSGSANLSGLADGNITVTISATDTAGNTAAGASGATVLDTIADEGGDLAVSVTDNLIGAAEKANVAYTVTGLDGDATATVTFSDGKNSVVGVNGVADLSGLTDGPITATVSATDAAGNTAAGASGATVLDTTADQGGDLAVSVTDNLIGNAEKTNVAYTVTGLDGDATATVTFTDGKNSVVGVNGVANLSGLTDGPITATVSATDTAGNSAAGTSGATVLDTTADKGGDLAVSVTDNLVGNAEKTSVAYTVAGLDLDATATVTFSDGKNSVVGVNGVADLSGLTDGPITASISATDAAGNTAAGTSGATVLDTTATATITIGLVTADNTLSAAEAAGNVSITGTVGGDVENGDTITLTVNGQNYTGQALNGGFSIDVKGSDLAVDADSTIDASVSATDAAGNTAVAQDSQTYLRVLNQAPVITSNGGGATAAISVPENSTAVTTVAATDPDAGTTLLYSLSGADAGKFQISSTGVLSFVSAPDFEIPGDVGANNVYDVVVQVSDGTLTDSQAIAVTVTNVSGNIPGDDNDNVLIGTDEEDTINGLGGNDLLRGKLGKDALDGGSGSDTVDYSDKTAAVVLTLNGSTNATAFVGGVAEDTVKNVENIIGGSGDDTLTGDGQANVLKGGAGKDILDGGNGSDTVDYSDKTAAVVLTLNGSTNATATVGGVAEDTVRNIENVIGGSANDTLTGDSKANVLSGGNGSDVLTGGAGADTLDGGAGGDRASYQTAAAAVIASLANALGNTGDAAGDIYISVESLTGSNFNDTLTGSDATNSIIAGTGDDTVFGLGGNDSLFGQDGNDVLVGGAGADALSGGNGSDRASYDTATAGVVANLTSAGANTGDALGDTYASIENVTGSAFADILTGTTGTNSIIAGLGDDKVFGLAGNDNLFGQDGNDVLVGGSGADAFSGGVGSDTASYEDATAGIIASLVSPAANTGDAKGDTYNSIENLTGSAFADTLTGNNGANILNGGNGSDVLTGGAGADTLDGGAGGDRVSYETAAAAVIASLANALGNTGDAAGDIYISVESLTGSNFNDTLTGSDATNSIIAGTGDDTVFGLGGNDSLFGQDGNDLLVGGSGADALSGGNGSDRASYDTATAAVVVSLTNPGVNTGDALGDTYASIENVTGSAFADILTGTTGTNSIIAGLGDDKVFGLAGNDNLFGQDGNDVLVGGSGADAFSGGVGSDTASYEDATAGIIASLVSPATNTGDAKGDTYNSIENLTGSAFADTLTGNNGANILNGGNGADMIVGGLGNDTLTGGAGADTFFFNAALNGSTNVDTITDFSVADDTFRLENTGFFTALTATGTLASTAFVVGTAAADALDRIIYNSSTGIVSYDSDGTGANAATAFAKVTPLTALTNLDFFVV
jgi:Ca2+-binding RTX toxin-like protein